MQSNNCTLVPPTPSRCSHTKWPLSSWYLNASYTLMNCIHKISSEGRGILAPFLQMGKKVKWYSSILWVYLKGITKTSELGFTPWRKLRRDCCHNHFFKGQMALIVHRVEMTFLRLYWKSVTEDRIEPRSLGYCVQWSFLSFYNFYVTVI